MNEFQNRFFVVFCLCVSVALAEDYVFTGDFVETRESVPNATTSGTFYYLYSTDGDDKCRFRVNYDLGVDNLYRYLYDTKRQRSILYSMCDECTAEPTSEMPDIWWYDSNVYTRSSQKETVEGQEWYWYNKKNPQQSDMVSSILMNGGTTAETTNVSAISFKDGRTFRITNFKHDTTINSSSAYFEVNAELSPTSSVFADLVFVLQYSGSVSRTEWTQTSDFVIGVLNNFTFGNQAVAAACIQYNAPSKKFTGVVKSVTCNDGSTLTVSRYNSDVTFADSAFPGLQTATVLAGIDTAAGRTVTDMKQNVIAIMSQPRAPSGNTCQAFGLELAANVFDISPRSNENPAPARIVIVVSDGQEMCPNKTQKAAKKLREQYGAFLIEIGAGAQCDYDREFLSNLTSTINGSSEKAFFSDTYSGLPTLVNSMVTLINEQFGSPGCGPACKGFCGCGKCWCPTCNLSSNRCETASCTVDNGVSDGCVMTTKYCYENYTTKCTIYSCDNENAECKVQDVCEETRKQYPYACQSVTCNAADGTCPVTIDDDFCTAEHNDGGTWRCAREGEVPDDNVTGCVLVKDESSSSGSSSDDSSTSSSNSSASPSSSSSSSSSHAPVTPPEQFIDSAPCTSFSFAATALAIFFILSVA